MQQVKEELFNTLMERGNFIYRVDIEPTPGFPIFKEDLSQRLRRICFSLNKKFLPGNGRTLGNLRMTDKFWFIINPEGNGIAHQHHYHCLLNVPLNSKNQNKTARFIANIWKSTPYCSPNSTKEYRWITKRQEEMDRERGMIVGYRVEEDKIVLKKIANRKRLQRQLNTKMKELAAVETNLRNDYPSEIIESVKKNRLREVEEIVKGIEETIGVPNDVDMPYLRSYPWEREYPPNTYAPFPLHIEEVRNQSASLIYNFKEKCSDKKYFFVGLNETRAKQMKMSYYTGQKYKEQRKRLQG